MKIIGLLTHTPVTPRHKHNTIRYKQYSKKTNTCKTKISPVKQHQK